MSANAAAMPPMPPPAIRMWCFTRKVPCRTAPLSHDLDQQNPGVEDAGDQRDDDAGGEPIEATRRTDHEQHAARDDWQAGGRIHKGTYISPPSWNLCIGRRLQLNGGCNREHHKADHKRQGAEHGGRLVWHKASA